MKKTWIEIKKFKFSNLKNPGLNYLNKGKFKTSPWIYDIIKKYRYNLKNFKLPIKLVRIKVKDLGFKKPSELKKIYKRAKI